MTEYVLRLWSVEGKVVDPDPVCVGKFLESFNVEYAEGRGCAKFTGDVSRAMRFATHADALRTWNTQSRVKPLREDGRPNKPLTAFTMTIDPVPPRGPVNTWPPKRERRDER